MPKMPMNVMKLRESFIRFTKRSQSRVDDLTEEELRRIFTDAGIVGSLGYQEIGGDIRFEKTIRRERKRPDIQCLDEYGNVVFVTEFKKPADGVWVGSGQLVDGVGIHEKQPSSYSQHYPSDLDVDLSTAYVSYAVFDGSSSEIHELATWNGGTNWQSVQRTSVTGYSHRPAAYAAPVPATIHVSLGTIVGVSCQILDDYHMNIENRYFDHNPWPYLGGSGTARLICGDYTSACVQVVVLRGHLGIKQGELVIHMED